MSSSIFLPPEAVEDRPQPQGGFVAGPFTRPEPERLPLARDVLRAVGRDILGRAGFPNASELIPEPSRFQEQGELRQDVLSGGRVLQTDPTSGRARLLPIPETREFSPGETLGRFDPVTGEPISTFTAPTTAQQDFLVGATLVDTKRSADDPARLSGPLTPEGALRARKLINRAAEENELGRFRVVSTRNPGDLFTVRRGSEDGPIVDQFFGDNPRLDQVLVPNSGFVVTRTPGGSSAIGTLEINLEKSTKAKEEQKVIGQVELSHRLQRIEDQFLPEFFQTLPQVLNTLAATKERLGFEPSEEERTRLARFATLGQDVDENLSLFIKDITGAQMSEPEARRLSAIQVNRGDSPTQAAAKIQNKLGAARMAIVRSNILLSRGLTGDFWNTMTLLETKQLVNRLTQESMDAFRAQGLDDETAFEAARSEVKRQIGFDPVLIVTTPDGAL